MDMGVWQRIGRAMFTPKSIDNQVKWANVKVEVEVEEGSEKELNGMELELLILYFREYWNGFVYLVAVTKLKILWTISIVI